MEFNKIIEKINCVIIGRLLNVLKKMHIFINIAILIEIIVVISFLRLNITFKTIIILISFAGFIKIDKYLKNRTQRKEIFKKIKELDDENQGIFDNNNPFSENFLKYPTEEEIEKWEVLKYKKIKPNNQKILKLLSSDSLIIPKKYKELVNEYKLHLIEYNLFLEDSFNSNYKLYPKEIKKIIKKYGDD